jgi:CheY-like chemotaxis protein
VVALAENGPEALEMLRAEPPDVVVCDLGLPGMSGYDLARAIRADAQLQHLRLIALTGYGQPDDRARTAEAGFDEHLVKPVDLSALQRVLSGARSDS